MTNNPYPVGTPWWKCHMEKEEQDVTIYIKPSSMPPEHTLDTIRSEATNKVLARCGEGGIYFWERFSRMYHLMTWEKLAEMCEAQQHGVRHKETA